MTSLDTFSEPSLSRPINPEDASRKRLIVLPKLVNIVVKLDACHQAKYVRLVLVQMCAASVAHNCPRAKMPALTSAYMTSCEGFITYTPQDLSKCFFYDLIAIPSALRSQASV